MDSVPRLHAFKERHPDAEITLTPNRVTARIPGVDQLFWAMSLGRLVDQLEAWEAKQEAHG
jgi:hypothetical protein